MHKAIAILLLLFPLATYGAPAPKPAGREPAKPKGKAAAKPASKPASKPATKPTTRPSSQPTSQPTSQPAKPAKPKGGDDELTINPDASIDPAAKGSGASKPSGSKGKSGDSKGKSGDSNDKSGTGPGAGKASAAGTRTKTRGSKNSKSDGFKLRTVSIIGRLRDRARVAASAHVVTERELERFEYNDIQRQLEKIPGVYARGEDGFGLRPNIGMRGAASDRSAKITLLEDGVLLAPAPYSAPAAYYFPLMTRLTGIEVFKGPAAITQGPNTIGGAINLRTADVPRRRRALVDIAFGRWRLAKVHGRAGGTLALGKSGHEIGLLVEGVHLSSTGFKKLADPIPGQDADTGFAKNEVMLKARWHSDPAAALYHQVDLKAGYSDEVSRETYLGLTDDDFADDGLQRYLASQKGTMRWWRTQLRLDYFLAGARFDVAVTGYRQDFRRSWFKLNRLVSLTGVDTPPALDDVFRSPTGRNAVFLAVLRGEQNSVDTGVGLGIGENLRTFVSQGVQLVAHARPPKLWRIRQHIEVGLRLHYDSIRRDHTEDTFSVQTRSLVQSDRPRVTLLRNMASSLAFAAYLRDEVRIGDLLLSPGLRLEHIRRNFENRETGATSSGNDTIVLPGVGAFYQLTEWLGVLAGVHLGFSPVAPGQPDDVKPEKATNVEWGARLSNKHTRTRAELIGYFSHYSNITGNCTLSSGCTDDQLGAQYNGGEANVYGIEALGRQQFKLPGSLTLGLRASYTLTISRFLTSFRSTFPQFGDVDEGDSLPYVPEHQLAVGAQLAHRRFSFALSGTYVSVMRDIAGQGDIPENRRVPGRFVIDLAAAFMITPSVRVYGTVNNLLDNRFIISRRPIGARPGQPLTIVLGVKYSAGQ